MNQNIIKQNAKVYTDSIIGRLKTYKVGDIFSVFEIKTLGGQTRQEIAYRWEIDSHCDATPCFIRTSYYIIKSYKLIGRLIIKSVK